MKKIHGFTLIELIATIVILGLIMVIGIPSLIKTLNSNDTKVEDDFKQLIASAAEFYVEHNRANLDELELTSLNSDGGVGAIDTVTLIEEGYLKASLTSPNGTAVTDYEVTVTNNNGVFEYVVDRKES